MVKMLEGVKFTGIIDLNSHHDNYDIPQGFYRKLGEGSNMSIDSFGSLQLSNGGGSITAMYVGNSSSGSNDSHTHILGHQGNKHVNNNYSAVQSVNRGKVSHCLSDDALAQALMDNRFPTQGLQNFDEWTIDLRKVLVGRSTFGVIINVSLLIIDAILVSVTPGGRWSKFKTYSTIQRTMEIWGFVLTFVFRVWLDNQKFSYRVFVPVGGGGLIAGIAAFVKRVLPEVKIIGVEPCDANAMALSLHHGERVVLDKVGGFADGVAVKVVGEETFRICRELLDGIVLVSRDAIYASIKDMFEENRSILEPAGALALAGAEAYCKYYNLKDANVVAIASGANMNFNRLGLVTELADVT